MRKPYLEAMTYEELLLHTARARQASFAVSLAKWHPPEHLEACQELASCLAELALRDAQQLSLLTGPEGAEGHLGPPTST